MGTVLDVLNMTVPFLGVQERGPSREVQEQSRDPHCRSVEAARTQKWMSSVRSCDT